MHISVTTAVTGANRSCTCINLQLQNCHTPYSSRFCIHYFLFQNFSIQLLHWPVAIHQSYSPILSPSFSRAWLLCPVQPSDAGTFSCPRVSYFALWVSTLHNGPGVHHGRLIGFVTPSCLSLFLETKLSEWRGFLSSGLLSVCCLGANTEVHCAACSVLGTHKQGNNDLRPCWASSAVRDRLGSGQLDQTAKFGDKCRSLRVKEDSVSRLGIVRAPEKVETPGNIPNET